MDFSKKGNREFFNDKLLFKVVGIIFLVIIVVLIIADLKIYQKKKILLSQINAYQRQIENIKNSSQTLKDEIANQDNKDWLEKFGYEQAGEARPGETVYSFISAQDKTKINQLPENFWDVKTWTGWMSGTWQWIKSKF